MILTMHLNDIIISFFSYGLKYVSIVEIIGFLKDSPFLQLQNGAAYIN